MFGLVPYRRDTGLRRSDSTWDIGNIVDNFFNGSLIPTFLTPSNTLRADVKETDKEYVVDVEIPGVKKGDIKLDLRDDVLNVSIEKNEEIKEEKDNYIRREIRYGSCNRSFYVPNISKENVKAKYDKGILTVNLPKAKEVKDQGHNIEVQ